MPTQSDKLNAILSHIIDLKGEVGDVKVLASKAGMEASAAKEEIKKQNGRVTRLEGGAALLLLSVIGWLVYYFTSA